MIDTSRLHVVPVLLGVISLLLPGARAAEPASLVANGNFKSWTDGMPDGWEITIGAQNGGDAPKSKVARIKGPALMLRGDAATMAWHSVGQQIHARPGERYHLDFESRTKEIEHDAGQYNNCYVGVLSFDASNKLVARDYDDVSGDNTEWTKHRLEFAVPDNAASTKVVIFLSKSGILAVKDVSVTAAATTAKSPADSSSPAESKALVVNGDFKRWNDKVPDGWKLDIGARNGGDNPKSVVTPIAGGGVSLQGNAGTLAWHSLSQGLAVEKDKTYNLTFEAQAKDVRREGRQYDNCFVGVMIFDAAGKRVDMSVEDVSGVGRWKSLNMNFRVPDSAAKTELLIFLSKSGTLMVKDLQVEEANPLRPFRGSDR